MSFIQTYCLPLATALLLTIFFMQLPALNVCRLSGSPREDDRHVTRADIILLLVITLSYALVAFRGLGDKSAPESFMDMGGESIFVLPQSDEDVCRIMLYTGVGTGQYDIVYSDGCSSTRFEGFVQSHSEVLKWQEITPPVPFRGGVLRINGFGTPMLGEVVLLNAANEPIPISAPALLCDEQEKYQTEMSYLNSSYFDEIYHARTAWEQLHRREPYEVTHPPLGKLIIGIGISLFGMTPFGWRFCGTLFGVLMLPLMYIFLKKLFGSRGVAAAGTLVFATDFMHLVQTRIATIDSYAVFFTLLMTLFMYLFVSEGKLPYLALSGVSFGFGAACKWTCLYSGAGLAVVWLLWVLGEIRDGRMDLRRFFKNVGFCLVFFVAIPVVIYCLSYIPYALARNIPLFGKDYFRMVWDNQVYMLDYHAAVDAEHPYSSRWYQWLLDIRPILYYLKYNADGTRSSFGAFVNPVLCWGGLLSMVVLVYLWVARRDRRAGFIVIGYLAQLVPWMFVKRVVFEYHYFSCTVFLVLAVGYMFSLLRRNDRRWVIPVSELAVLSTAVFILFYPVLTGRPVIPARAKILLQWLKTWPF